jgi:hypothetical protein
MPGLELINQKFVDSVGHHGEAKKEASDGHDGVPDAARRYHRLILYGLYTCEWRAHVIERTPAVENYAGFSGVLWRSTAIALIKRVVLFSTICARRILRGHEQDHLRRGDSSTHAGNRTRFRL